MIVQSTIELLQDIARKFWTKVCCLKKTVVVTSLHYLFLVAEHSILALRLTTWPFFNPLLRSTTRLQQTIIVSLIQHVSRIIMLHFLEDTSMQCSVHWPFNGRGNKNAVGTHSSRDLATANLIMIIFDRGFIISIVFGNGNWSFEIALY